MQAASRRRDRSRESLRPLHIRQYRHPISPVKVLVERSLVTSERYDISRTSDLSFVFEDGTSRRSKTFGSLCWDQ